MVNQLDSFDRKLLDRVQRNADLSAEAIGQEIGLSGSAVLRRLKRLKAAGVIQADVALVDPAKVGIKATTNEKLFFLRIFATLATVVVLPVPLMPRNTITYGPAFAAFLAFIFSIKSSLPTRANISATAFCSFDCII